MKTLIISSGRSGSKFILKNVFNVYKRLGLENIRVIYEPFLWNFEFKSIDELSASNIFTQKNIDQNALNIHLRTPQYYLTNQNEHQFHDYFNHVLDKLKRYKNVIVKINRSPSRMQLFLESGKFDKVIYLYNNPLSLLSRLNNSYGLDGPPYFNSNFSNYMLPEMLYRYYPNDIIKLFDRGNLQQNEKNLLIWFISNQHFLNFLNVKVHYQLLSLSTDILKLDTIGTLQILYNYFDSSFLLYDSIDIESNQFSNFLPFDINTLYYNILFKFHMDIFYDNLFKLKFVSNRSNIVEYKVEQIKRIVHDKFIEAQNNYFVKCKKLIIEKIENFLKDNKLNIAVLSVHNLYAADLSFIIELDRFILHLSRKKIETNKLESIISEYIKNKFNNF
jgi:hypothetical protein